MAIKVDYLIFILDELIKPNKSSNRMRFTDHIHKLVQFRIKYCQLHFGFMFVK